VKLKRTILSISLLSLLLAAACQSANENANDTGSIVVVNAPAAGQISRVLVGEGVHVDRGTPIVEILVQSEAVAAATPARAEAEAKAIVNYESLDKQIELARADAVQREVEVARLTPLVSSGEAPQGQLDGARALYEEAQRRLTSLQAAKKNAEGALLAARQPNQSQGTNVPSPREQIVSAVASSPGKVAIISVRVGDRVKVGQPLATLRADN
jgi:multidrug efflux pump subunit AcrA (membrane-fusion protein)